MAPWTEPRAARTDSAWQTLRTGLIAYGLGSLSQWAWGLYKGGSDADDVFREMTDTDVFKTRFPAYQQLRQDGRAISVANYLAYEKSVRSLVHQYGLPGETYNDPRYIANLLLKGVDAPEMQERAQLAQAATLSMPQAMRDEFTGYYGVSQGDLTGYYLNPDINLGLLQKRHAAAALAGEVKLQNLGDIARTTAERMAEAGISVEQARAAGATLSPELNTELEGESGMNRDQLVLGATNVDAGNARALAARRSRRVGAFAASGQAYTTEQGVSGLGTSARR